MQLLLRLVYPLSILTIYDEHQALSTGVVVSPQRTDFILPPYIPYIKFDVLIRDRLHVEADCSSVLNGENERDSGLILQTHLLESL